MLQGGHSGDSCDLTSTLCKNDLRKGDLFVLCWTRVRRGSISSGLLMCGGCAQCFAIAACGYMPGDNRCMYMAHVCFYVCCSDCVGVCGNMCCVTAVIEDSVSVGVLRYIVWAVMDVVFLFVLWSCGCSCMGSMSVSSCRCMFVSCVHTVAVLNSA